MKATQSLVITMLVSIPLTSATTVGATANAKRESSLSAGLISERNLQPTPSTIFLNNSAHALKGVTSIALLNGSETLQANGPGKYNPFLLGDCETPIDEADLVVFGGGDPREGTSAPSGGTGKFVGPIPIGGLSFGQGGSAAAVVGMASLGGGGFSGDAGGGGGGGGGAVASANGGATVSPGSPAVEHSGPAGNGSTPGTTTLVLWNILPANYLYCDNGSPKMDGGGGSSPLPLPAPVWMALAGLILVVAFRRRLLP